MLQTGLGLGNGRNVYDAFASILSNTADVMYIIDADMTFRAASKPLLDYLGLGSEEDLIGRPIASIVKDPAAAKRYTEDNLAILETGLSLTDHIETLTDAEGNVIRLLCSKYALRDENGVPSAVLCISRNSTREYDARQDYVSEIDYLLSVSEDSYGAWLFDITDWRVAEYRLPKGAPAAIPAHETIDEYIEAALEFSRGNDEVQRFFSSFSLEYLLAIYKSGRHRVDFEYQRLMATGELCWLHMVVRLRIDPETAHLTAVLTLTDINKEKTAQNELIKAAEIDSMTGVLNHDATLGHISAYLKGEGAGGTHALIMVDRDKLKQINDTLGHKAGDDIIVETAKVLQSSFRDTDIVGRVGGDEFLVLMKNIGRPKMVRRKAAELLQSLQCICGQAESAVETTGSIGVSFYQNDHKTPDKLYAEADTALYRAKAEGRNRFILFDHDPGEGEVENERDPLIDTVNLRTLLNSIDGGILILHLEPGRQLSPVFFSDSFLTMMGGLTQDEALELYGGGLFDHIHPDDRERVRAEYSSALESCEPLRTTYRLIGKDGEYRWLSAGTNITKNPDGSTDVYAVHTNIEKLMHREEKLASDEQRFRVAFTQTSRMLCEVDIATNVLNFFSKDSRQHTPESVVSGLPESVIASGFIHEKSADAFRAFYLGLRAGKIADSGLFRCRYFTTGVYGWGSFSYQMVYDGDGKPQKAIGSIEELPNITQTQERFERESMIMDAVREDMLAALKADLTRDVIEDVTCDSAESFASMPTESYTAFYEALLSAATYQEDALLLQLSLARKNIIDAYSSGKHWISVEYRRLDEGEIRWTRVSVCLIDEPASRSLYAFIYIDDVEKRRGSENLLPVAVDRDAATHLYTQGTVEKLVDSFLRGSIRERQRFSLAVIRLAGLASIGAKAGAEKVDRERIYICRFLSMLLDRDCIVGRYSRDCVLVFCPDIVSDEWIQNKIESAIARVSSIRSAEAPLDQIKLICGIAIENSHSADYSGMLSQAMCICDAYQNSDTDSIRTFTQYVDIFRVSEADMKNSAFITIAPEELSRPLFGLEKEAMGECQTLMLASDHYDNSVSGALGVIGKYYRAQRVYTLSLLDGNTAVSGLHEWVAVGRHSTLRQMTGLPMRKLPMFSRVLAAARPVILNGNIRRGNVAGSSLAGSSVAGSNIAGSGEDPWYFITLPVITDNKVQGFMCIENPEAHKTDVAFPAAVIPVLLHERARFGLNASGIQIAGRDSLTGLPDRSTYESDMQAFNPDAYHSIGVMYVSASNLREQNRLNGVAYGDEILVFASHSLSDIVKKSRIYRLSGTEFAAICTNLSQETFNGFCLRSQSVLQRRYPKCFSIGSAWSDKGSSARKLLNDAESYAHNGAPKTTASIGSRSLGGRKVGEIIEGLSAGRFFIYLQPQVDMRTGQAVGAEALARCRDNSGNMVLPAEFVHYFEEAGVVRELDYFVLEQVFSTLQNWIMSGYEPLPISLNFSRQTLMSTSVLASSMAIHSRYDVPDGFAEIEITETVGDYEPEPMRRVMDSMYQQGFRFALDDLGSEYSSLKTLGDLSFSVVKLDKSLINSFLFNTMSHSVVESIVGLCAKNEVRCIAEGVESEMQVKGLLEAGCTVAQGFYYGKPMPVEDFQKRFLKKI